MPQALESIRVLDLSRMLPGPFASMMLGDLGAEVIKVEEPRTGDPTRWSPPLIAGQSAAFLQVNRSKKSIALDLKRTEGREIFLKLAERADVVLDQFRPGVVDRLGIGYAAVSSVNPRIVYCSLTGFGQDGPHRDRSGHDLNYLALSGVLGLTTDERGKPVIPGVQIADLAGGMIAAYGIIAALYARERTGRGQFVDVSMYDVMMTMLAVPAAQHFAGVNLKVGDKYGLSGAYPFYNVYETGDGRFMTLGALEPKFWENFCRKAGREDLIARQFDTGERRRELFEEVAALFKSRTQSEWVELMRDADACCEPVLALDEAFEHAQARAREMVHEIEHPVAGAIKQLGFAPKLSDTAARVRRASPALGEQTDELLAEIGMSEAEREQLYRSGIARRAEAGARQPDAPPLRV
ncbi:MAG TPA: CaiB/BaiF CoA-transferase family protein [Blastocatellia bacterium]|nr:CaiB/BaiF CoA-transferase family protein [Blastocatellia bacterium]